MTELTDAEYARIVAVLAGTGGADDLAWIQTWRASDPAHETLLAHLERTKAALERAGRDQLDVRMARLRETIEAHLGTRHLGEPSRAARRVPAVREKVWSRTTGWGRQTLRGLLGVISAAALLLAGVLVSHKTSTVNDTTRTYTTRSGQLAIVQLLDGTRVTLAPRTTLRLVRFGAVSRLVELDGQAYFEVARSAGAAFVVRTGAVTTRVLGTTFLIRHYSDDARVHVAVADGKVGVQSDAWQGPLADLPRTLTAGFVGEVSDSTIVVSKTNDLAPETDWLRGQLVFRRVPVSKVLRTLSQWYGFHFQCRDSLLIRQDVTIAVNARSAAAALATLEQTLSVSLTVVGDTVTLMSHPMQPPGGTIRRHMYDVWTPTREVGR